MFRFCDTDDHLIIAREWPAESARLWSTTNALLYLQLHAFKTFYDLLIKKGPALQFPLMSNQSFIWQDAINPWLKYLRSVGYVIQDTNHWWELDDALNKCRCTKVNEVTEIIVETPDAVRSLRPRTKICIYDDLILLVGGHSTFNIASDCRLVCS